LIVRYEELRRQVLGRYGGHGNGLALLMHHGMSAWMQAWSQCAAVALPAPTQVPPDDQETCPVELHREVATILANMALFSRQEVIA
jgi:hypothetical protein